MTFELLDSSQKNLHFINCDRGKHSVEILYILNDAIANSTALYDYHPRTLESMSGWFNLKQQNNFPIIGIIDDTNRLLGFATWGTFRNFPAYKYTVEHSVYVHPDHRGKGIGKCLLKALINKAMKAGLHSMIGGIDSTNTQSIYLHTQLGFTHAGTLKEVGFKFGHWLNLEFYQLTLDTSLAPVDG